MLIYTNILVLLLSERTLCSVLIPLPRGCPTCEGKLLQGPPPADLNATTLAVGEPCGVYTLSCAQGLRCEPPQDEQRPLRALLEGRGVCKPTPTENPNEVNYFVYFSKRAPCRKLLTTLTKGLEAHLFKSHHEIYMPNCDKRGFFKKKQCWSSRGKQRGKCWCVDEDGTPIAPKNKQKGSLSC
uniref:Thyroglobulin type-1 domain-containing protein n=1 Tax=Nothobranchius furzeri TaxID=105023 RepID=A0A8C6PUE1_NOTFU